MEIRIRTRNPSKVWNLASGMSGMGTLAQILLNLKGAHRLEEKQRTCHYKQFCIIWLLVRN